MQTCLHKMNITQVEIQNSTLLTNESKNNSCIYLVDASLYIDFIETQKTENAFCILVTSDDEPEITDALIVGANTFINIAKGPEHFVHAIEDLMSNRVPESTRFIRNYIAKQNVPSGISVETNNLTPKEAEILRMMRDGKHLKLIASDTSTSYETIRTHVKRIYQKLGVGSASEALLKAIKMKL